MTSPPVALISLITVFSRFSSMLGVRIGYHYISLCAIIFAYVLANYDLCAFFREEKGSTATYALCSEERKESG
jgi:hypothetical protein